MCADVTDERPVGDSGKRFWSIYPPCGVGQYRGSVANVFDAEQLGPQGLTLAERDANAALIASAPELYSEAAKLLAAWDEAQARARRGVSDLIAHTVDPDRKTDAQLKQEAGEALAGLRAALAKATGND